jgi:hypothetical protein
MPKYDSYALWHIGTFLIMPEALKMSLSDKTVCSAANVQDILITVFRDVIPFHLVQRFLWNICTNLLTCMSSHFRKPQSQYWPRTLSHQMLATIGTQCVCVCVWFKKPRSATVIANNTHSNGGLLNFCLFQRTPRHLVPTKEGLIDPHISCNFIKYCFISILQIGRTGDLRCGKRNRSMLFHMEDN